MCLEIGNVVPHYGTVARNFVSLHLQGSFNSCQPAVY